MRSISKVNILSYMTTLHSYSSILIQKQHKILLFFSPLLSISLSSLFPFYLFRLYLHIRVLQQQFTWIQTLHGTLFPFTCVIQQLTSYFFIIKPSFPLSLLTTSGHENILHYTNSVLQVK